MINWKCCRIKRKKSFVKSYPQRWQRANRQTDFTLETFNPKRAGAVAEALRLK